MSSALHSFINDVLRDPLRASREQSAAGTRVIGMVGADVPAELIIAAGAAPVQLPTFADPPTALADRYLESGFAAASRSIVEQWLSGALEHLDAVVFSRANDGAQRLYYYLCELQRSGVARGPRPLLYDLAKIRRSTSVAHTLAATRRLAQDLGVEHARLAGAIAQLNRRRELLAQLALLRLRDDAPPGEFVERVARAAELAPATAFDSALAEWLGIELQAPARSPARRAPRIALMGSAPPDERLHAAVAQAGGCIVDEIGDHSLLRLGAGIVPGADPLAAIASHYQTLALGPRSFHDRAAEIVQRAAACRAAGVVLWLLEEDEALVWDVPGIRRALASAGTPLLCLTRRRWDARDDTLDAIGKFTETLT